MNYFLFTLIILLHLSGAGGVGVTSMRAKLNNYFQEKQIDPKDIPKAVAIHEFLGLAILSTTWTLAYHYPPSQIPLLAGPIMKMKSMLPESVKLAASNNKMLSSRLGGSFVEASAFRKVVRPLTIPLKLFATYKILSSQLIWSLKPKSNSVKRGACGPRSCSIRQ